MSSLTSSQGAESQKYRDRHQSKFKDFQCGQVNFISAYVLNLNNNVIKYKHSMIMIDIFRTADQFSSTSR